MTSMPARNDRACEHEFVLTLSGVTDLNPRITDALFEAGCDDATLSIRRGRAYLEFTREAPSLREAILSAIRDVSRANIGASVLSVDVCNLVSQSDIARRIGRTRQQVGQYIASTRGPGNFPPPVFEITSKHPLWSWCQVSQWLYENAIVGEDVLDASRTIAAINGALTLLEQRRHDSALVDEVLKLLEEPGRLEAVAPDAV
jgi:hypothetical protein